MLLGGCYLGVGRVYNSEVMLPWSGYWVGSNSEALAVSEDLISDPNISVRATMTVCGAEHQLPLTNARGRLLWAQQQRQRQHWTELRLQGKTACLPAADHSVSHSVFKNVAIDECIVVFTLKARLPVLPTKLNLSIWFPGNHTPYCIHHGHKQIAETMSHILNGCHVYRGLYICRHDRIVDLISKDISSIFRSSIMLYKHSTVKSSMFNMITLCSLTFQLTPLMSLLLMKPTGRCLFSRSAVPLITA